MRCKRHLTDLSSTVGVCASCLRDRLFALIAAQAQAHARAQAEAQSRAVVDDNHRKSDPNIRPPPLVFPRSVSPYVSRRKSDGSTWQQQQNREGPLFYSTPQVRPTYSTTASSTTDTTTTFAAVGSYRKKNGRFSLLSNLFRSRSEKFDSDPRVSSRESAATTANTTTTTSSSSPSWFAAIFSGRRKKQSRLFVLDESTTVNRIHHPRADRGMSPARTGDSDECDRSPSVSGYSTETWRSPAFNVRRTRQGHNRNVSGIAFCLSPLVRASPNRHWSQKGLPPEIAVSGEARALGKPQPPTAASFCKNRSRKLVDFGRVNHNR